jgi:hypothetical protein
MHLQHIKVISVNVHRQNERIHALLHNNPDTQIILIQEPWFKQVAVLPSDTEPLGTTQQGAPIHPSWDVHTPILGPNDQCKAVAYTRKYLRRSHLVTNVTNHPLANPSSIILDVMEGESITMRLINTYHRTDGKRHNLTYLFNHTPDATIPTVLCGDLNTHSLVPQRPYPIEMGMPTRALDRREWLRHTKPIRHPNMEGREGRDPTLCP